MLNGASDTHKGRPQEPGGSLIEAGLDYFIDLTQQRDGLAPYEQIAREQARALGRSVRRESYPVGYVDAAPGRGDGGRSRHHRRCVGRGSQAVCALLGWDRPHWDGGGLLAWSATGSPAGAGVPSSGGSMWRRVGSTRSRPRLATTARLCGGGPSPATSRCRRPGAAAVGEVSTRDRFRGCVVGLAAGTRWVRRWSSAGRVRSSRSMTWSAGGRSGCGRASGPTTRRWRCVWPPACWPHCLNLAQTRRLDQLVTPGVTHGEQEHVRALSAIVHRSSDKSPCCPQPQLGIPLSVPPAAATTCVTSL